MNTPAAKTVATPSGTQEKAEGTAAGTDGTTGASASGPGPHLFRDVAGASGVSFKQTNGETGDYLMISTTPGGCALFDYNNDGFLDVFLVQSGPVPGAPAAPRPPCALFRNDGDGRFTDVTRDVGLNFDQGYAQGVATGDYDNDGFADLFVTSYNGCFLLHNESGKRFTDVSIKAGVGERGLGRVATAAAFGDYDRDGKLDLIVLHYVPWSRETDKVCKDSKGRKSYCSPEVYGTESPSLYRNKGNGTFEDVTKQAGLSDVKGRGLAIVWTDIDSDGYEDIYIANDLQPNQLLRNEGGRKFTEEGLARGLAYGPDGETLSGMGIACGDYDNSGQESYVITNFSGQPNTVYRAASDGLFEDATYRSGIGQVSIPFLAFGIEFFDFDRDSWRDLIIGNGHIDPNVAENAVNVTYAQAKLLMRNKGEGQFERVVAGLGDPGKARVTRGLAVGDYDNDGRIDILTNNHNDVAELFHNESQDENHWVMLRMEGVRSNRDGLGALVTVTANGQRYIARCRQGSSYSSVSDKRLFFGLGKTAKIDAIEVRWPSGKIDAFKDLGIPADTFYLLREGEKPVPDARMRPVKVKGQ